MALEWASEPTMLPYNKVHEAGVSHRIVHGYTIMEKDVYDTVLATARRMHLQVSCGFDSLQVLLVNKQTAILPPIVQGVCM